MTIGIYLATEDEISEVVAKKIIAHFGRKFLIYSCFRKNGFGYLKSKSREFCDLAKSTAVLLITDLDNETCPAALKKKWFAQYQIPESLIFCVAVREVESWLLADNHGIAQYLGLKQQIDIQPELLLDPKQTLLNLAKGAKRQIKSDLLPERGSKAIQGLGYNASLAVYVANNWSIERAAEKSNSLQRTISKLDRL